MITAEPKVSIIIPNYNRALLIPETLDSIRKQSYKNWECIIVDDGSTDDSIQVIEEFVKKDNKIKLVRRGRKPKGAPTCRNIGFTHSVGELIIFLDSDDILAPYCLSTRIYYFQESPECDFLIFPMLLFKVQPGDSSILWNINNEEDDLKRFLEGDTPWAVTCPIWKKDAIKKIGDWDEEALAWQDWEFHIKAILQGLIYKRVECLPDCFVRRDTNERISKGDLLPLQLYSKINLFLKIYSLLKNNNKLTHLYKTSFANLLFIHAERCAVFCPNEPLATNYSNKIIEFSLLPRPAIYLQSFYIKSLIIIKRLKIPLFSTLLFHAFRLLLPYYLTKRKANHLRFQLPDNNIEEIKRLL